MELTIRAARHDDVPRIVELLADDELGRTRERPGDPAYLAAFAELDADPRHLLVVAELGGAVVGTLQLSFIPGLSHRGTTRALIEAVRTCAEHRGRGIGGELVTWAVRTARERGAGLVQLTSDRSRTRAHRFYERLGFESTHVGMKRSLDQESP